MVAHPRKVRVHAVDRQVDKVGFRIKSAFCGLDGTLPDITSDQVCGPTRFHLQEFAGCNGKLVHFLSGATTCAPDTKGPWLTVLFPDPGFRQYYVLKRR